MPVPGKILVFLLGADNASSYSIEIYNDIDFDSTAETGEIILKEVRMNEGQGRVYLEGYLPDISPAQEILAGYSASLREVSLFEDVNTISIIRTKQGSKNIIEFKMSCKLIRL